MNKKKIINKIAKETNFTKKDTENFLNTFIDVITDSLNNDEKISIQNFLTFEVKDVAETKRRNPRTGEIVAIPLHKKVKVKVMKGLRDSVK